MARMRCSVVLLLLLLTTTCRAEDDDEDDLSTNKSENADFKYVTCGSVIKLKHQNSGARLHSHEIPYGSGSQQQSVTGQPDSGDLNSFWTVKGPYGKTCKVGSHVKIGTPFRLEHLNTKKNLHSHDYQSPITKQFEVSAFGDKGDGDINDNWVVEPVEKASDVHWLRGQQIRLKHSGTSRYLSTSSSHKYSNPINGQQEVSCVTKATSDTIWATAEGIHFPALS
mmetsp:Transcript_30437/g.51170  ORF Transcript_30437/g.51170 Transcript_30437/m.51170 type:complete len:224 (-) Transcript_30437:721-1392(-)|eukprot:CAMPEP_0184665502 /NCGR_PEP_ID=MMETSP0308-20130426/57466_1 /TAXON_ID=38269 /ORGANISM="Gloeochaete witrockiana, Strain SAG 46.84" /LENGTH=223 /DNA_ID=CAMNT_0027109531 /DNA_START=43 /DNA_END=714 /DNA_ORIENTATION=+